MSQSDLYHVEIEREFAIRNEGSNNERLLNPEAR